MYVRVCVRAGICVPVCVREKSIRMYQYLCECPGLILIFKVFRHTHNTHTHKHNTYTHNTYTHSHTVYSM